MNIHIQALDHVVLNVADVAASLGFYCEKLGLQPERVAAFHAGEASFPSVRVTPQTIIDLFPPALHLNERAGTNLNHRL